MATEPRPAPIDPKRLRSQRLRGVNFQGDALRLGMNWTKELAVRAGCDRRGRRLRADRPAVQHRGRGDRPDDPLLRLENVVITPHAAHYSEEAIGTVRSFAADEVVRVLTGQPPLSPVNADDLVEARWARLRS